MPILMEHKIHGFHHVYSDADAITHEKIGWKRVKEIKKPEEPVAEVKEIKKPEEPVAEVKAKQKKGK